MVYMSVKNGRVEPILGLNALKFCLVFKNAINIFTAIAVQEIIVF
jgi:hypothetical protein